MAGSTNRCDNVTSKANAQWATNCFDGLEEANGSQFNSSVKHHEIFHTSVLIHSRGQRLAVDRFVIEGCHFISMMSARFFNASSSF